MYKIWVAALLIIDEPWVTWCNRIIDGRKILRRLRIDDRLWVAGCAKLIDELCIIGCMRINDKLWVTATRANGTPTCPDEIGDMLLYIFRLKTFSETRWLSVGRSCRGFVGMS